MTGRYTLSPRARGDLDKIWDTTLRRWGMDQAESYIRQLFHHVDAVAARPAIGRSCFDVRPGYYKYRAGSHVLFFRQTENGIEVVRILHERMDFGRHL